MDSASAARRKLTALESIESSAVALAKSFECAEQLAHLVGATHKDPQVANLFKLEAIAELLAAVVSQLAPVPYPESALAENEFTPIVEKITAKHVKRALKPKGTA